MCDDDDIHILRLGSEVVDMDTVYQFHEQEDVWTGMFGIDSTVENTEALLQEILSWEEYTSPEWNLTPQQQVLVFHAIELASFLDTLAKCLRETMHPLRFVTPIIGYTTEEEYEAELEHERRLDAEIHRNLRFFIDGKRPDLPTISSR